MSFRQKSGFSLIELMLVTVIITFMLLALSANFATNVTSKDLAATAQQVIAKLEYASQLAVVKNRPVMVRFAKYPDPSLPPSPGQDIYHGVEFGVTNVVDGSFEPLSEFHRFPESITLHLDSRYSSVMDLRKAADADIPITFQFRPNGTTTLPADRHWSLTFVLTVHAWGELPPNYRTVVINPFNGAATLY